MSISVSFNSDPEFTTENATQVTAFTVPIAEGNTCRVVLSVFARGYVDGISAMWSISGVVKRVEGVVSIISSLVNIFPARKEPGSTLWDVDFVVNGDAILVRVQGAINQKVGWTIDGMVYGFSNVNYGGIV